MSDSPQPLKRRAACDACRKRKIRCSGESPSCRRCDGFSIPCHFSAVGRIGRPRRQLQARPGQDVSTPSSTGSLGQSAVGEDVDMSLPPMPESLLSSMPAFDMDYFDATLWPEPLTAVVSSLPPLQPSIEPAVARPADTWPVASAPTSTIDGERGKNTSPTRKRPCDCARLAHENFSYPDDSYDGVEPLLRLRRATQVAEKLLNCTICFDTKRGFPGVTGNVYLLSALLSSIASSYTQFLDHHKRTDGEGGGQQTLCLGHSGDKGSSIDIKVSSKEFLSVLRTGIRADTDGLTKICDAFAQRQLKLHSKGHESCAEGWPCASQDATEDTTPTQPPPSACPNETDPTGSYLCFQAVRMVRASILELRTALDTSLLYRPC
ncbi:hypothetical protein S7711_10253 [Stachybotrys chartarum IBT 7711]|uniref:Zn(2)-C6 fungal-type domain-containing protein n=1 Tax=Stachybotrys chartarum (strain CBS 109288 / IBT 7711) TaxID=1280523 RepID=A0A084AXL1_STACB|nr:hypothetical protein S7711_10253 [Stachybotrys chartarum IBT 7711]KFA79689.1 hypothetical protein S40288_10061 [Stachybotrys chartarum IBT 40288]